MINIGQSFQLTFLDASRVCKYGRCPSAFLFECLMGLVKPDAKFITLDYGTAMHKALPRMYHGDIQEPMAVFTEAWSHFNYGDEDARRNMGLTYDRICNFVNEHTSDKCPYEIVHFPFSSPTDLISENEVPFLIDIGIPVVAKGRIDAVVKWKADGALWAYDFKTSSELSTRYFASFNLAPQPNLYTIALSQIIQKPVQGLMLEAMGIYKTKAASQVQPVYCPLHHQRLMLEYMKRICNEIMDCCHSGNWPQNLALCHSYSAFGFAGGTCPFIDICDSHDPLKAITFYSTRTPFDPLEVK